MRSMVAFIAAVAFSTGAGAAPRQCQEFQPTGGAHLSDQIERPSLPGCVPRLLESDDRTQFEFCQSELDAYRSELQSYFDCLHAETTEAADDYNGAVRQFNCKAAGSSYC